MKHQTMLVAICGETITARTDKMIYLREFAAAGNAIRALKGQPPVNVSQYLVSQDISDFIAALIRKYGGAKADYMRTEGKGKSARVIAHLYVAIKVSMRMDSDFEVEIIDNFVKNQLLDLRLDGGDMFKALNAAIDRHLPSPSGNNRGRYITAANMIRARCNVERPDTASMTTWNQSTADSVAQKLRLDIEEKLTDMLRLGLVRDWDHLKEIIERI